MVDREARAGERGDEHLAAARVHVALRGDVRVVGQGRDHSGLDRRGDDHAEVLARREQVGDEHGVPATNAAR